MGSLGHLLVSPFFDNYVSHGGGECGGGGGGGECGGGDGGGRCSGGGGNGECGGCDVCHGGGGGDACHGGGGKCSGGVDVHAKGGANWLNCVRTGMEPIKVKCVIHQAL